MLFTYSGPKAPSVIYATNTFLHPVPCLLGDLGTLPSLFSQSALPRRLGSGAKWEGAVRPLGHRQAAVMLDRAEPGAAGRGHLRGWALRRETVTQTRAVGFLPASGWRAVCPREGLGAAAPTWPGFCSGARRRGCLSDVSTGCGQGSEAHILLGSTLWMPGPRLPPSPPPGR